MNTRRQWLAGLVSVLPLTGAAAELNDLLSLGENLLGVELEPDVRRALEQGSLEDAGPLLSGILQRLQGEYVLDLAEVAEGARVALPLLERRPETRDYAAWLKARLDYFDVAEFFREQRRSVPPPGSKPPNPTPGQERKAWSKEIEARSAPPGSATWVPRLKPEFRRAGCPPELVWLAEIESSFEPAARSPAGAVGMFQLMPATARGLGLKLSPRDERLDPVRSGRAAASYLRQLHRQFKDWPLAAAAYNAGPGRVADTLRRRRATSYEAIAPSLPAETQMYVPKLEAVLRRRERAALGTLRLPA